MSQSETLAVNRIIHVNCNDILRTITTDFSFYFSSIVAKIVIFDKYTQIRRK